MKKEETTLPAPNSRFAVEGFRLVMALPPASVVGVRNQTKGTTPTISEAVPPPVTVMLAGVSAVEL